MPNLSLTDVDLLGFESYRDGPPHAMLALLRREDPVHWHPEPDGGRGFWAVTKHADVVYVSRTPKLFSSAQTTNIFEPPPDRLAILQGVIINMDPPRHVTVRNMVNKGFTPRRIAMLEPFVRRVARGIVEDVARRGSCDFVEDVAALLPMTMICELFGIPESERRYAYGLANRMTSGDDPEQQAAQGDAEEAFAETFVYATQLAALKRRCPAEDLATVLVQSELDGKPLDDMAFGTFVLALIVAGNETTRTVTTNGMLRLIQHPDQRRMLVENPALIANAVEEMLRYDPAVHHFRRTATEDTELRGARIKQGDKVVMWYASANRDDEVFAAPDEFDIRRANARDHVTFGIGQHFCLGATLARLQLNVIFEECLRVIPDLELDTEPKRLCSNFINGVKEMRVRFTPVS
jgi:cytochrome P450